ncbi:MAG: electron transfer flavoprotein subunit beta/FixA family protein [Bacteroidetes bacterium]|nr:electron transfer flavoprotein subunit beta/FixA family protein [Bacteroidota bacterium]MCW5895843.1 electron transfer flavoprotein subunit beta/FixA family protein [Bacteroidota bacterium]
MKIVVCVNHVPDTETKIKVGADSRSIDKTGVNFMLSPYDEFAVEEGLRLKEKFGGEITVISLGSDAHKETLRKALAMGVEKAILLKDDAVRDSFGVAKGLAEELKAMSPDIILFGKQSIDYDDAQVGTMVAELLGISSVSVVVKLTIDNGKVVCEREIEGGHETVETSLPCVIQAQRGLNEPRYPSLKGIMSAKTKPIQEKPAAAGELRVESIALRKPEAKAAGKIVGTDKSAVPELVRLLHEEAKVI